MNKWRKAKKQVEKGGEASSAGWECEQWKVGRSSAGLGERERR